VSTVQHLTIEALLDEAAPAVGAEAEAACHELRVRIATLRRLVSGDRAAIDAVLDGEPLSFVQLLDKIMEEMERAGVADAQGRSIEAMEDEPHRNAAHDYRAMLEERAEKVDNRARLVLDGRK
jgi:hypothetical protein